MWSRAGLKPNLSLGPRSTQTPKRVKGDFDVISFGWANEPMIDAYSILIQVMRSKSGTGGVFNWGQWGRPDIDALIDKAGVELDPAKAHPADVRGADDREARASLHPDAQPADGLGAAQHGRDHRAGVRQQAPDLADADALSVSAWQADGAAAVGQTAAAPDRSQDMLGFLAKRLANAVGVMLAVALIAFLIFRFVGDPVELMLNEQASQAQRDELRERLGLNRNVLMQFLTFVGNVARAISASPTATSRRCSR